MKNLEAVRLKFKPSKIKVLFVGETYPTNGSFFYNEDSVLYRFTKEAFDEYYNSDKFNPEFFMQKGCYLFDISKAKFGMTSKEKVNATAEGIPVLAKFIEENCPEYIISTNSYIFNAIIMANAEASDLVADENIFDLPTPIFGSHHFYKDKLVDTLKLIDLK
jgi:hypothetical protein